MCGLLELLLPMQPRKNMGGATGTADERFFHCGSVESRAIPMLSGDRTSRNTEQGPCPRKARRMYPMSAATSISTRNDQSPFAHGLLRVKIYISLRDGIAPCKCITSAAHGIATWSQRETKFFYLIFLT